MSPLLGAVNVLDTAIIILIVLVVVIMFSYAIVPPGWGKYKPPGPGK